uniref:K Homology domain-containing protein n=1 Tax=Ascaris lumbricoides TaxID=6252 RepID=A0A9J2PCM1_ASCLU
MKWLDGGRKRACSLRGGTEPDLVPRICARQSTLPRAGKEMENGTTFETDHHIGQPDLASEGSLNLAPGAERHHAMAQNGTAAGSSGISQPEINVLNYSTDFPELPEVPTLPMGKPIGGAWSKPPTVRSQVVTQVFQLRGDERASRTNGKSFGNTNEEQQRCNEIAKATDTTIELCEAKDHSLTVLITGKRGKVEDARSRLVRELQTQATREIAIPKEHHRILIGKEGSKLRQLEQETDCRIVVPGRDSPSDIIRIIGPREGIEKAVHEIQLASDKQSKLAQEHLMIPRIYYPWIRGPNNETMDALMAETGAKINIPPPSANNEIIVITGEKEGVHRAADELNKIYEEKKANAKPVTCQVARAQHRYVIGPQRRGLTEILKETGVSVEVPTEEEDSDTITLRGDPAKLGEALALVYAKASSVITSEISCEHWMHKFLIGPKGSTLQTLVPNKDKVQIDFEDGGTIYLEGPPEDVKAAQTSLTNEIDRLTREMSSDTIKVHPSLHRHVIGRGGALISKIKEETGVQITIPNEQTNSDEIKVEGKKEGVKKAIEEIAEIVKRIENEKSRDILIEQRFHKQIIGAKGEAISKLREQYPSVVFSFPDASKKSDVVNLRGDKNEVDKVFKQLTALNKELVCLYGLGKKCLVRFWGRNCTQFFTVWHFQLENNFQMTVPIFKEFHKHIIGKGGANVRKIREDTQTRIDLPGGESGEDKITVTGKKANVEKAVEQLTQIQNELASIVTSEVSIPQKVHSRLLGGGRRLIHDIQDQCGGVHIKFPPEKSSSDKVSIRGPKEDVAKAEKMLLALAKDRELSSFEDSVKAKSEFHRFLIGRGGGNIKKIREKYPDVRILFPRETDTDDETIHLLGKKEEVAVVKKQLESMISELNETVEMKMDVDPKYHRHFVMRGAAVLREIQEQNGGVIISFPRAGSYESKVTIKGIKQCVESAKARIEEIVEDLAAQVTIQVEIPSIHHRALLSNRGQKVQDICTKYNVQIKFPDRRLREEAERLEHEGAGDVEHTGEPSPLDMIVLSGRDTKCEEAKQALLALVPITKKARVVLVHVAYEHHRYLIGRSGETVRSLMQAHDVNISIPHQDKHLDEITVTGQAENVEEVVADILKMVTKLEESAEDRKLRSFKLSVDIPQEYHTRLIGFRGRVVNELQAKHNVEIAFPRGEDPPNTIVLTGYEKNCEACKEEMEAMVGEVQSLFTQEISLDASFHPRLIGQRRRNVRKVMEEFQVEIRFPRANDPDPNLVVVAGKNEDAVYDCIDYLRGQEEDYLQERNERGQYLSQRLPDPAPVPKAPQVKIEGAPWQLDMQSEDQFPSMGTTPSCTTAGGAWGGVRRF